MIPELLSPAGNRQCILSAVHNGADAVYLGGKLFNARHYASNFDDYELENIIDLAHERNVKIYLTLNTLLNNDELSPALEYANKAYSMGVDAVIVQDLGFSKILKEQIPDIPLHASTQMTIYNKEGVDILLKNSFDRVVLSRELSIKEISHIKKATSAQLEIFIHGSLCVCYSGQCLFSAAVGNFGNQNSNTRSGNKGTCAQPCRLKYKLASAKNKYSDPYSIIDEGYLFSTRDICSIEFLKDLIQTGVDSFKIEGRMKSPEYVGAVTSKYRKAIDFLAGTSDSDITPKDKEELLQIFNRGGFSKGYFYGKTPAPASGIIYKDSPKNMGTPLGTLVSFDSSSQSVTVKLKNTIQIGDGIEIITMNHRANPAVTKTGDEKYPGGIVTGITVNNNLVKEASPGQIVKLTRIPDLKNFKLTQGLPVIKTSSKSLNKNISQTFDEKANIKKIPINVKIVFNNNTPVALTLFSLFHNISCTVTSDIVPQTAQNNGILRERIISQLTKTDIYPFYINSVDDSFEEGLFIPISELNNLRRSAFNDLLSKIKSSHKHELTATSPTLFNTAYCAAPVISSPSLSVFFDNINILTALPEKVIKLTDTVILPVKYFSEENENKLCNLKKLNIPILARIPPVYKDGEINTQKFQSEYIDGFLIGNIGSINIFQKYNKPLFGDIGLNVCNIETVKKLYSLGLSRVTLSPEISNNTRISHFPHAEILVYGNFPIMNSEYCPVQCIDRCGNKTKNFIIDKMGEKYPVLCDNITCRPEILTSGPRNLINSLSTFKQKGFEHFKINFYNESLHEAEKIICQIKK